MTCAGAMGAAFIGRSAAIAEPAKPAVIAIDARSFFIVHSARFGDRLGWSRVSMLPIAAHSSCAHDMPEACKRLSPVRHNRGEAGREEVYFSLSPKEMS